jgi:UDP-N-acetylmuramoylalanine--D-glutamate ligase
MLDLQDKLVLVLGLGPRGRAACEFLRRKGARVMAVESGDNTEFRNTADELRGQGIEVELGVTAAPKREFEYAVVSPAVPMDSELVRELARRTIPVVGELEVAFQEAKCLSIAVAGTNGKGTTGELIERVLTHNHRKSVLCGHQARPVCSVVEQTKELDYLILQVNAFQLETAQLFRPAVAVLMNLSPDHLDRYAGTSEYVRASARLFANQQAHDWAIVQSEAADRLHELNLPVPAKTITFSASDPKADLHLDRGLLISSIPNWAGPLLDSDTCQVRGPHNAENLMAALAVGHVLRLPLENMLEPMRSYSAGRHRFETVAEVNGVQYINDSKATNLDALHQALVAAKQGQGGQPNIWLIAGGVDKGLDFHDVGPLLSKRVKHALLIGAAAEKIRAAWSLFIPCTISDSLINAVTEAAGQAAFGDVVLLSPACSSFDQFRDYQERGEIFCQTVKSISRGGMNGSPNRHGKNLPVRNDGE